MYSPVRLSLLITGLFLCCFLTPTLALSDISQSEREATYKQLEVFSNVLSILQENYVEEIDTKDVISGAIKGLLFSLDPHSSYLPPESFDELQEETRGSFSGIGIEVTIKNDLLTIVTPISDTPADKAGLKANDLIIEIEGEKTKSMSPFDAIQKLRGPAGSEVTISVHREGWDDLKKFTIKREIIPIQSVKAEFLSPGFVYTRITKFQSHTSTDFKSKLTQLEKEQPVRGLILDLRSNPGGLLQQAVAIADIFLDHGTIVYTKGRRADQNTVFSAHTSSNKPHVPLVVLVNEGSASAAEIVAGAIQAHKRGILVGAQTFGKGSVQTIIPLPDGAGLRMTTAKYYTPDDRSIQAMGIIPDVEVPFIPCVAPPPPKKKKIIKEIDLTNHLPGLDEEEEEPEDEVKEKLETRLQADNQLRTAYNILKSLNLYSEYKNGETQ